jgi:hypothetical protein
MFKTFIFSASLLLSGSICASERTCYANPEDYMVAKYGSEYRRDENLVIRKERYGKQEYYVESDTTSGTNSPLTLLLPKQGKGICKVLSTPPVSDLDAIKFDKRGRPLVFVTQDQGITSREITYSWDRISETFKPTRCREITSVDDKTVRKIVSCKGIAE